MRLKSIKIIGFRNLKGIDLHFEEGVDLIAFVGANGHGKTNLLESIFITGLSKSFRTRTNSDIIGFDQEFCRIDAEIKGAEKRKLEVIVTRHPAKKTLKTNGVIKNAIDFVGHLPVVFFSPDDMTEMASAPRYRRRYLDVLLSQLDHEYVEKSIQYGSVLKQRNALLRNIAEGKAKEGELDFWDMGCKNFGSAIIRKRKQAIEKLEKIVARYYRAISRSDDQMKIIYASSIEEDGYGKKFTKERRRDIVTGHTNYGPHRDDLHFFCNEQDMTHFASRGEWRSLVLALKFAEKELLEDGLKKSPILLLDDVFSELDDIRQKYLIEGIKNTQVFISTTHIEFLKNIITPKRIYTVREGRIGE